MLKAALSAALVGSARAAISFGSMVAQDPLPPCQTAVRCNGQFCGDVCVDGTVQIDDWAASGIRFQYELTADRSFKFGPILGTHNAFISRALGLGLTEELASAIYARVGTTADAHVRVPNQRLGPTDLLNIGVREMELDLWDFDWSNPLNGSNWEVYLCHSPIPDPQATYLLQQAADKLGIGALRYNPFKELCSNNTFAWGLNAIKNWLSQPDNDDQVVALFLDNRVAMINIDLVTNALVQTFGDSLMTPSLLASVFNNTFPSRSAMIAKGFRVYAESNSYFGNDYSNTSLSKIAFYPTTWSSMQLDDSTIQPFPNCTAAGAADPNNWYGREFVRVLDSGDLAWSPNEEDETDVIYQPTGISDLVNCGLNNIGLGAVTPTSLTGYVWSWAPQQPTVPGKGLISFRDTAIGSTSAPSSCSYAGAMTLVRGQWTAQPCSSLMRAVCRKGPSSVPSGDQPGSWALTASPVSWLGAFSACSSMGAGWAFDVPRDGRENQVIAQRGLMDGLWGNEAGFSLNVLVAA